MAANSVADDVATLFADAGVGSLGVGDGTRILINYEAPDEQCPDVSITIFDVGGTGEQYITGEDNQEQEVVVRVRGNTSQLSFAPIEGMVKRLQQWSEVGGFDMPSVWYLGFKGITQPMLLGRNDKGRFRWSFSFIAERKFTDNEPPYPVPPWTAPAGAITAPDGLTDEEIVVATGAYTAESQTVAEVQTLLELDDMAYEGDVESGDGLSGREDGAWVELGGMAGIDDAPSDSSTYVRKDAAWESEEDPVHEAWLINPELTDLTLTNHVLGAPTYETVGHFMNSKSAGLFSGGVITDNANGTVTVASGSGMIKMTDDPMGTIKFFDWEEDAAVVLTDEKTNYVYINYNISTGVVAIGVTLDFESLNYNTQFMLGLVYLHNSTEALILDDSGTIINNAEANNWIRLAHRGIEHFSGALVAEKNTRYLTVTAGAYAKGVTTYHTDAVDTTESGDDFRIIYRSATPGEWTDVSGEVQFSNILYDDGSGTPQDVSNGKYAVHWVYQCTQGGIALQYGQSGSYNLAQARAAQPPSPPSCLANWAILRAKIIILRNATNALEVISADGNAFVPIAASNHNELSGLQGGGVDSYYHNTSAEYSFLQNLYAGWTALQLALAQDLRKASGFSGWKRHFGFTTTDANDLVNEVWEGEVGELSGMTLCFDDEYVYVGLGTFPGKVLKVDIDTMMTVDSWTAGSGGVTALDYDGYYLYVCLWDSPTQIVKINPSDMSTVGTWTGAVGQNYGKALIVDGTYVYVGMNINPGQVEQVTKATMVSAATWTGAAGENKVRALTYDGTYVYAGLNPGAALAGKVAKIDKSGMTTDSVWTGISVAEKRVEALKFDGMYLYAGLYTVPASVARIDPTTMLTNVVWEGEAGTGQVLSMTFDDRFLYLGLKNSPGKIVQVQIDSLVTAFVYDFTGTDNSCVAVVGDGIYIYTLLGTNPAKMAKQLFPTYVATFRAGEIVAQGTATLVGGTLTVVNRWVAADSLIMLTHQVLGTIARPVGVGITAQTAGTSFTITSNDATDTSDIGWIMFCPN